MLTSPRRGRADCFIPGRPVPRWSGQRAPPRSGSAGSGSSPLWSSRAWFRLSRRRARRRVPHPCRSAGGSGRSGRCITARGRKPVRIPCAYSITRLEDPPLLVGRHGLSGSLDELHEALDLQARPAHQGSVHGFLGHDVRHVVRLDGATVEDSNLLGEVVAPELPQQLPDPTYSVLAVVGGGRVPGPDGPDWLVGEDDALAVHIVGQLLHHALDLTRALVPHTPGVALLLGLPHAHDRQEPGLDRPGGLSGDHVVRFAEELAP